MSDGAGIDELNREMKLSGCAEMLTGNGGFPKMRLKSSSSTAEIYLYGAQITSWKPNGVEEVLFLSEQSHWEEGRAIRGGIPVCFPWFRARPDDPQAPTHGFVRTKEWRIESVGETTKGLAEAVFSTESDEASRAWWPFDFRLEYRIAIGETLKLELEMKNTGQTGVRFQEALHTYFNVGDVKRVRVQGLDGVSYLDNTDGNREKLQSADVIPAGQTDNAYRSATGPVEILDAVLHRRLRTDKQNSGSTIVWNPWSDGAAKMADMADGEWQRMLCVEGGNVLDGSVELEPGASHVLGIEISLLMDSR